jgi:hypothetical protein
MLSRWCFFCPTSLEFQLMKKEFGVAEAVGMTMMTTMSETVIKICSDVHYVWINVDM